MSTIDITLLEADQLSFAASLLARAFMTNPLHVAAFGAGQLTANEAFFRLGLQTMKGRKLAATGDSRIVGVMHWVRSPNCQFSGIEKLRMLPKLVRALGLRSSVSVMSWLTEWSKLDPAEPHIHLGPIGVDPDMQGRRIGHQLMEVYCQTLDREGMIGYLETDRPENVAFYKRFHFEIATTTPVLGVPNFFMRRSPARSASK